VARISLINKESLRQQLATKFRAKRDALRNTLKSQNATLDEKMEASAKLTKLPRDSSVCRQSNRCRICGRSHGVYSRRFKICRLCLRNLARQGMLPGIVKSSW
jgi:small subunit ribosomal protein S14